MQIVSFALAVGFVTVAALGGETHSGLSCATCHPAQAIAQPQTSMGRALQWADADPLFVTHKKLTFTKGAYSYTLERRGKEVIYSVTDGSGTLSLPIRYCFGTGTQTFVIERDGRLYESVVSYYKTIDALDTTMGDQDLQPKSLLEAAGRELPSEQATACFSCHTTGAVQQHQLQLNALTPGVTCEHCHSGAAEHFEAVSHGKLNVVPPKLKQLSPESLSNFCGQCHRTWETVIRNNWQGVINVRFQPYRLANSKCFDGIDARISCVACHDPHQEIVRDEKSYDRKCLACHSSGAKVSAGMLAAHPEQIASQVTMKTCPVAKTDCVTCHMPKTELPGGHMVFFDHDIRVVRAKEAYPH